MLLRKIEGNSTETITSIVRYLSKHYSISESTLKANSRILRKLNLITFGNNSIALLTKFGKFVIRTIGSE